LPCPPPGDLPNSGIKLRSPALQVDSLPSEPSCSFFVNKLYIFEKSVYLAVVGCNVVVLLVRSRCFGGVQKASKNYDWVCPGSPVVKTSSPQCKG